VEKNTSHKTVRRRRGKRHFISKLWVGLKISSTIRKTLSLRLRAFGAKCRLGTRKKVLMQVVENVDFTPKALEWKMTRRLSQPRRENQPPKTTKERRIDAPLS